MGKQNFIKHLNKERIFDMEEKGISVKDYAGCGFTSILGLLVFGGFCMFMFWLVIQCTGYKM